MKNIKKHILLILGIGFSVTGCYDDDPITPVEIKGQTDIALTVTAERTSTAAGFEVPFTATIPNAFSSDVDVEASLTFDGGVVKNSVTIPAGDTSASGSVVMQGTGGLTSVEPFIGKPVTLSLTGLVVSDPEPGDASVFNVTSNEVAIASYDIAKATAYTAAVVNNRMTYLFQFDDCENNDLDAYMYQVSNGARRETSESGTCFENDIFNAEYEAGEYYIRIDAYSAIGEDIAWHLFFVDPDGTTLTFFEGVFPNVTDGNQFIIAYITKTITVVDGVNVISFSYRQAD